MRRFGPPCLITLLLATSVARAEDFSGFYAGVNAGSAFERDRFERDHAARRAGFAPVPGNAAATRNDLPPSVARTLRVRHPAAGGKVR